MSVATGNPIPNQFEQAAQQPQIVYRERIRGMLSVMTSLVSLAASFYFALLASQQASWQLFVITGAFSLAWIFSIFARTGLMFKRDATRSFVMSLLFQVAILAISVLIANMAIAGAAFILLYSLIMSSNTLSSERTEYGISVGLLMAAASAMVGTMTPFRQIYHDQLFVIIPTMIAILVMVYIVMAMMQFIVATLRIKLVSSILALVLIPLIMLAFINSQFTQNALQAQINQSLNLAGEQTANQVDDFLNKTKLSVANQAEFSTLSNFLRIAPEERQRSLIKEQLLLTINSLQFERQTYLSSIAILNMFGENIYDTSPFAIGTSEKETDYFVNATVSGKPFVSPIKFSQDTGGAYLFFSAPIRNADQQLLGVLRVRYDALVLQSIIDENSGSIGSRSHPILLDENMLRIADSLAPSNLYQTIDALPNDRLVALREENRLPYKPNSDLTTNLNDLAYAIKRFQFTPFFSLEIHPHPTESHVEAGAISVLKSQPWTVVFVQEEAGLRNVINDQNRVSTMVAAIIATLVGLIATLLAQGFSNPIQKLTSTASKVSQGDLTARAVVETNDEIGTLANAFNSMTTQLNSLINSLEDRVRDRTQELATQNQALFYRSRQLQTVADVARGIAGAQDLEALLTQITSLISERFNFYHVGVFLLDDKKEFAILRAANSEGGMRMLARQHKLSIGKVGIVGYVTSTGEARIATDVGEDAVFFNNPDLPMTRSEMALPLKVSGQIIGALDVQSTASSAFSMEDIALFNTLADQVAIAIENNRLFTETASALEEAQNIHRQYLRQEWNRELSARQHLSYVFTPQGLMEQEPEDQVFDLVQGKDAPVTAKAPDENRATAAASIQVRGETVGVIRVQDNGTDREWTEDELNTIKSVADQVAVALENARLFEQTVRRAEREKKALEITNKIRSTNDPQEMLRIAVAELQGALNASRAQIIMAPKGNETEPSNGNGTGNHKNNGKAE